MFKWWLHSLRGIKKLFEPTWPDVETDYSPNLIIDCHLWRHQLPLSIWLEREFNISEEEEIWWMVSTYFMHLWPHEELLRSFFTQLLSIWWSTFSNVLYWKTGILWQGHSKNVFVFCSFKRNTGWCAMDYCIRLSWWPDINLQLGKLW